MEARSKNFENKNGESFEIEVGQTQNSKYNYDNFKFRRYMQLKNESNAK